MRKKENKLRIFRIIGLTFIILGIIMLINVNSSETKQVFQIDSSTILTAKMTDEQILEMKDIIVTQNVPIPEELKLKMEKEAQEKAEQERIVEAEQERLRKEAEEKAKKEQAKKVATKKTQVTSRGGSTRATGTKAEYQAYAKDLCINTYGWSGYDFECLVKLWERESNWNPNAHNKKSGAHGICQSLPASKMASEGADYMTNGKTQIRWGLKYIKNRYGSPSKAWQHSQNKGWY